MRNIRFLLLGLATVLLCSCGDGIAICGDGKIQGEEVCDDGEANGGTEVGDCMLGCMAVVGGTAGVCGDDILDAGEDCDDGNTVDGDECPADCLFSVCGDGTVDDDEECDDGNTEDGDECPADCIISVCGDGEVGAEGVVNTIEECDCDESAEPNDCDTDNCQGTDEANPCTFVPTAYRMANATLNEPILCNAIVRAVLPGVLVPSMSFAALDLNGLVDLGITVAFAGENRSDGEQSIGQIVSADCNGNEARDENFLFNNVDPAVGEVASACAPSAEAEAAEVTVTTQTTGTCLEAIAEEIGSDAGLTPANGYIAPTSVDAGDHGCWVTDGEIDEFILDLDVVQIPLTNVRVAAQWPAPGETRLPKGMVKGYISNDIAKATIAPLSQVSPLLADVSLIELLATPDLMDPDTVCPDAVGAADPDPNDASNEDGWWAYLSFQGDTVPWQGGTFCGNGVVDAGETCDTAIAEGETGACDLTEPSLTDACATSVTDAVAACNIDTALTGCVDAEATALSACAALSATCDSVEDAIAECDALDMAMEGSCVYETESDDAQTECDEADTADGAVTSAESALTAGCSSPMSNIDDDVDCSDIDAVIAYCAAPTGDACPGAAGALITAVEAARTAAATERQECDDAEDALLAACALVVPTDRDCFNASLAISWCDASEAAEADSCAYKTESDAAKTACEALDAARECEFTAGSGVIGTGNCPEDAAAEACTVITENFGNPCKPRWFITTIEPADDTEDACVEPEE